MSGMSWGPEFSRCPESTPDPQALAKLSEKLRLPRTPRRRCAYCPKAATAACGCCCNECADVNASRVADALLAIGTTPTRVTYPRGDGGPSVREYLASKGRI